MRPATARRGGHRLREHRQPALRSPAEKPGRGRAPRAPAMRRTVGAAARAAGGGGGHRRGPRPHPRTRQWRRAHHRDLARTAGRRPAACRRAGAGNDHRRHTAQASAHAGATHKDGKHTGGSDTNRPGRHANAAAPACQRARGGTPAFCPGQGLGTRTRGRANANANADTGTHTGTHSGAHTFTDAGPRRNTHPCAAADAYADAHGRTHAHTDHGTAAR